jgi:hypothetical protein
MLALGQMLQKITSQVKFLIRKKGSAGQRRSAARIIHAIVFDIHHMERVGGERESATYLEMWELMVRKRVQRGHVPSWENFCQVRTRNRTARTPLPLPRRVNFFRGRMTVHISTPRHVSTHSIMACTGYLLEVSMASSKSTAQTGTTHCCEKCNCNCSCGGAARAP